MTALRLLGGFVLETAEGGVAPRLSQQRAEAVLAMLAVAEDWGCTRHRLIGLLWPGADEEHARHNLRNALHAIRVAVGPDAILTCHDELRLDTAVVPSDVVRFTGALKVGSLALAVRAYRGPLLDGFFLDGAPGFDEWLETERARLSRLCAEALERLALAAESGGDLPEAAAWWGQAVDHDRYNTRLVIQHLRALAGVGDRANALLEGETHRRRLERELGIDPDPALLAAIDRLRHRGP